LGQTRFGVRLPGRPAESYDRNMPTEDRGCLFCGAKLTAEMHECPSCGEPARLDQPVQGHRRWHLPHLSPVVPILPVLLAAGAAILVALLLPLIQWLRELLRSL
jgi:hypothetical protein